MIAGLVGIAIGFVVMMVVVGTLPRLGTATPPAPAADTRVCPHCAEEIKAAAKVCRCCSRDVPPMTS